MTYNTFIFDFDYTLAEATDGIVDSVNYAFKLLGFETASREKIRKTVGMTLKESFFELTGVSDKKLTDKFICYFKDMADKIMAKNTVLYDDTIQVLSQLKSMGCNTAIVTSKFHYRIDEILNNYSISELVDYIVGFEDVGTAKPSPEGILKAVSYLNVDKKNVLYVGDSIIDANTAKNASIDFAAVLTGATAAKEFVTLPHVYIVDNLTKLLENINVVLDEKIISAIIKNHPKIIDLPVDENGNIIIDKNLHPEIYGWAVNG